MLAWLPTYFVDTLSVDLMHAAQTALLPPVAGIAASAVAGPASDALIARGAPLPAVRKGMQSVAFLVPTACLLAAAAGARDLDPHTAVALITVALGMSSFSLAGLYCTHQDLSTKYSSALLGLTNGARVPSCHAAAPRAAGPERSWGAGRRATRRPLTLPAPPPSPPPPSVGGHPGHCRRRRYGADLRQDGVMGRRAVPANRLFPDHGRRRVRPRRQQRA
jgi:hypothetical protein